MRGTGLHANILFPLNEYLDLSKNSLFTLHAYYEGETLPPGCNIRLILRDNGVGSTQYAVTLPVTSANEWVEYAFDCSGAAARETSYNQVWLFFISPDNEGIGAGQVFYIDNLMGPPTDLGLSAATLQFRVTDQAGPLGNAEISLDGLEKVTDGTGLTSFEGLAVHTTHTYTIEKQSYRALSGTVYLVGDTLIEVSMDQATAAGRPEKEGIRIIRDPSGGIFLTGPEDGIERVVIYDLFGRILRVYDLPHPPVRLDGGGLANGIYIIGVYAGNTRYHEKILIHR